MGSERDIKVVIRALNLAEDTLRKAKADIGDMGDKAEDTGKRTEKAGTAGRLAFWGLGEVAETAGGKIGITGQAARMLGNVVEDVVAGAGRFAVAFGAVSIIIGASVMAYNHLAAAKKHDVEQTQRNVTTLRGAVQELYAHSGASEESKKATYNLLLAKRELLKLEMDKQLRDEKKALNDLEDALKTKTHVVKYSTEALKGYDAEYGITAAMEQERTSQIREQNRESIASIAIMKQQIAADQTYRAGLSNKITYENYNPSKLTAAGRLAGDAEYVNSFRTMIAAKGASQVEMDNLELAQFDLQAEAKMARLQQETATWGDAKAAQDAISQEYANRDMARQAMMAQQEEKTKLMRIAAANAAATNFVTAAKMMSEQGGAHARKYFSIYKATATAQALISTYSAAIKAFDSMASIPYVGPVLGALAAAAAIAMGMAQVKAIRSQSMDGGGGGGGSISAGGGVGTYPVSPGTGLPPIAGADSKAAGGQQITINVQNGLGTKEYWDSLMENEVIPAINRAGDRNVQLTISTA